MKGPQPHLCLQPLPLLSLSLLLPLSLLLCLHAYRCLTVNHTAAFSNGGSIRGYCSGMGYIMTHEVAQFIATNAPHLHKGYPEDAVVGMWLAATNFRVQHDERFYDWEWKMCSNDSILIHKHEYGAVDEDGVMRSCFPSAETT